MYKLLFAMIERMRMMMITEYFGVTDYFHPPCHFVHGYYFETINHQPFHLLSIIIDTNTHFYRIKSFTHTHLPISSHCKIKFSFKFLWIQLTVLMKLTDRATNCFITIQFSVSWSYANECVVIFNNIDHCM